jgi:3-phenylpropionate/trans-cinnamate dioxygenase ferredoxin subunit
MPLVVVAKLDDLKDNVPCVVTAGGREVALVKRKGRVHAVRNVCPHQTASFVGGIAADDRLPGGTRTEVLLDPDRPVLSCPWHQWQFGLLDGKCTVDLTLRVKVYPVQLADGRVLIEMGQSAQDEA